MTTPTVLLVDDAPEIHVLVARALGSGFQLTTSESVEQALACLEERVPSLILLDIGLPDGDGFQLCSIIQNDARTRDVPVVFLTSRGEARDRILAYSIGADDFVEKPFDLRELRVRVEARLKKAGAAPSTLQIANLRLDVPNHRALIADESGDRDLGLTPNEFRLLHLFVRHRDEVLTRERIRDAVWGDVAIAPRTIDTHLSNLRGKLGQSAAASIEAVRGRGYCLRLPPPGKGAER